MSVFHDEVSLDDFDFDEDTQTYTYPCPCGDIFSITVEELEDGEEIARCPSCSLILRVLYDVESGEEEEEAEPRAKEPQQPQAGTK
eukprot:m.264312 g.264312  ORF g.264312 m.264312 type:complete len:86 (+) comp19249_c0_seq5:1960-2217(+)